MQQLKKVKKLLTGAALISALFMTASSTVMAHDKYERKYLEQVKVKLQASSAIPFKGGFVKVWDHPDGPDRMILRVRGMDPNVRVVLLLTQDQKPGGLPAQMLGEFTTNAKGKGVLRIRTEVINAFASANVAQSDANGVAASGQNPPAGLLVSAGGGANTIPLNFFRGYVVDGAIDNVFGPDENTPGGSPVFESAVSLP